MGHHGAWAPYLEFYIPKGMRTQNYTYPRYICALGRHTLGIYALGMCNLGTYTLSMYKPKQINGY